MSSTRRQALEAAPPGFARDRVLVLGVSLFTFVAARAYADHAEHGPILCPLRGLVGLPCPGCGLTRAFCALSQGDLGSALAFNAFALPLALLMLGASAVALAELTRARAFGFYRPYLYSATLGRSLAAGVIVYHLGRLAYWAYDGTLVRDYLHASWTYRVFG
jgi:Protein of unknown function (DUF2752)